MLVGISRLDGRVCLVGWSEVLGWMVRIPWRVVRIPLLGGCKPLVRVTLLVVVSLRFNCLESLFRYGDFSVG